ncbi:MAG: HAMP domain-containing sensor histidine kinase [Pararobbsia sp.]
MNGLLERLNLALDAQRKFIADAAHQLRTPLTAIKLHAEQAFHARDDVAQRAAISELRASADRGGAPVEPVAVARTRRTPGSQQTARFVSVDLVQLAFETGAEWVPRAIARHIDLGFADDDKNPPAERLIVNGNPVLLSEVLANLIDNALKYVPPYRPRRRPHHDRGLAACDRDGSRARRDHRRRTTGRACRYRSARNCSKRFFRGDGHGESDGGAGLGLAIVRDIVVLHGGTIHYEDGTGGGSRFVIRLPLSPQA